MVADVSTPQGQAALLDACPNPDILINNNAGPPYRDFRELDRQALLNGLTMNMLTPIELIQKVIDSMQARQFGRIVNITSASVKMPFAGLDLSSGARAGLIAFVAGIARSVAYRNVTINALLPGPFNTDRLRGAVAKAEAEKRGTTIDAMLAERAKLNPAGRFGEPEEFGLACAFLCGAKAGFITGQNILLDGGAFPGTL